MPNSRLNELRILYVLAMMPFLESMELASLAALPSSTTADVLRRLHRKDIVEFVKHSRSDTSRVRRWCLTGKGVKRLASLRLRKETGSELFVKFSVSAQERRYVLRRLDVAAVLYRMACEAAMGYDEPVEWKWSRAGGLDAMMRLSDGRSFGLSRIGSTHSGEAIKNRLNTIAMMYAHGQECPTFLIVPGVVELRRALKWFSYPKVPVFAAVEDEVMSLQSGTAIWHGSDERDEPLPMLDWLSHSRASDMPRTRQPSMRRLTLQADRLEGDMNELDMVACDLTVPARRIVRLLFDWPFISVSQLQALLRVSAGHLRREKALLGQLGLVHHLRIGKTSEQRYYNETRLCLSRRGLTYLSHVDRSLLVGPSISRKRKKRVGLLDHWLMEPDLKENATLEIPGFDVQGSKAGVLLNELRHTDDVYKFVAMLADACANTIGWRIEQLLPAHRWERRFIHGRRTRSEFRDIWRVVKPDATIVLRHGSRSHSLLLEAERRAIVPSRMEPKIRALRNYYASADTSDDFPDGRPDVLVVFERIEDASRFASYAFRDGGPEIPMHVSSLAQIEAGGVFGRCWLSPWHLDDGYVSLHALLN